MAADVATSEALGAPIVFAIDAGGTRVAAVAAAEGGPLVLTADHLDGERPILVYRVRELNEAVAGLERHGTASRRGWRSRGTVRGVSHVDRAPVTLHELARPEVLSHVEGRRDL